MNGWVVGGVDAGMSLLGRECLLPYNITVLRRVCLALAVSLPVCCRLSVAQDLGPEYGTWNRLG